MPPEQASELTEPQARGSSHPNESLEPRMDGISDSLDVFPVEDRALDRTLEGGTLDVYGIGTQKLVVNGGVEHGPEHAVHLGHGVRV